MSVKLIILVFTSLFWFTNINAQRKEFIHCNCTETLTDESYKVISNGIEVESGQFEAGKRTGIWVSKNIKGTVIRKANYSDGKLNGNYELFHFNGKPKLTASFEDGKPSNQWTYFNAKGKVIKQGVFSNGKPTGIWKIMDKKGKKAYAAYDFDTNSEITSGNNQRYFQKSGMSKDDQSGEWLVLYFPRRDIKVKTQPLGGYMLSSDLFIDYFNIPTLLMDTYVQFEFNTTVKFENGVASVIAVDLLKNQDKFDITSHSLPFMAGTNPPSKLSHIEFSDATIAFLKGQLAEYVLIMNPWITSSENEEIIIRNPLIINEVKRW